nr:hypothetical protein CFP56_36160 [Quercus suber]
MPGRALESYVVGCGGVLQRGRRASCGTMSACLKGAVIGELCWGFSPHARYRRYVAWPPGEGERGVLRSDARLTNVVGCGGVLQRGRRASCGTMSACLKGAVIGELCWGFSPHARYRRYVAWPPGEGERGVLRSDARLTAFSCPHVAGEIVSGAILRNRGVESAVPCLIVIER